MIDPASRARLHEASLTLPTPGPQGYYPGGISLSLGERRGVIAWVSGSEVRYTAVTW